IRESLNSLLIQVKPPADVTDFERSELSFAQFKIWTQLLRGVIDSGKKIAKDWSNLVKREILMSTQIQVKNPKTMAFILMLGAFIGLFGETALNMALTNIMDQYTIKAGTAQWLTTGYLLVLAILVPITALLMRWYTTRKLVIGGLVISLAGAILAALSPSFIVLLLGRLVQAVGTGLILPVMTTVLLIIFPVHRRGAVMGIMGLVITLAPALGPTLSGVIISTLDWPY